nr:ABC transporter permease subunit [Acuticoccus mangrovi]
MAFSLPLAALLVGSKFLNRTVVPLLVVVQSTPIAAVAPLIVVALGSGSRSRILITVLITFFPIVVAATTGLRETPQELIELSRSLDAPVSRQYLEIRFPFALPYIFGAAKVAVTLAVIGAVLAEFVASSAGLGYLLLNSAAMFKVPLAYACLIVLIVLSLTMYGAIALVERRTAGWMR